VREEIEVVGHRRHYGDSDMALPTFYLSHENHHGTQSGGLWNYSNRFSLGRRSSRCGYGERQTKAENV
jgi:hypothetical protein